MAFLNLLVTMMVNGVIPFSALTAYLWYVDREDIVEATIVEDNKDEQEHQSKPGNNNVTINVLSADQWEKKPNHWNNKV